VQGNLNLSPPQEEDQTHKPAKWLTLKPDTRSNGQMQDHAWSIMCAQPNTYATATNSSAPTVQSACAQILGVLLE
jgi:hypothetical protein